MKLVIPKERHPLETRIAGSPDAVKRLRELGFEVVVESGAGDRAGYPDAMFRDAGAAMSADIAAALGDADLVLRVRGPSLEAAGWDFRRTPHAAGPARLLAPWPHPHPHRATS